VKHFDKAKEIAKIKVDTIRSVISVFNACRKIPIVGMKLFECSVYAMLAAESFRLGELERKPKKDEGVVNLKLVDDAAGMFDVVHEENEKAN
jgi:hypothetical protein